MSDINQKATNDTDRIVLYLKMTLLSDTIFGSGMSIPGEEDISVLTDAQGFPYYKGSTFKGVFREETERYILWTERTGSIDVHSLFGESTPGSSDKVQESRRLVFSDFVMSPHVRKVLIDEIGDDTGKILDCLSHIRAFTRISEDGTAAKGSLRYARCINQGIVFYSTLSCSHADLPLVKEILPLVKWIGTLRNRGFGKVLIEIEDIENSNSPEIGGDGA